MDTWVATILVVPLDLDKRDGDTRIQGPPRRGHKVSTPTSTTPLIPPDHWGYAFEPLFHRTFHSPPHRKKASLTEGQWTRVSKPKPLVVNSRRVSVSVRLKRTSGFIHSFSLGKAETKPPSSSVIVVGIRCGGRGWKSQP